MKFMSSNALKRAQYTRWLKGITFEAGPDLREISSYPEAVAIYKSLMSGPGTMIDDTSLYVLARPELKPEEIRWNEEALFAADDLDGTPVRAEVWLAVNDGVTITTYQGTTDGRWLKPSVIPEDCADFDIGLVPGDLHNTEGLTLYELLKQKSDFGDKFSPRYRACAALEMDMYSTIIQIKDLKEWQGAWQK